jgi:hypothetical protein
MKSLCGLTLNIRRIILQYVVNKAQGGGKLACSDNCLLSFFNLSLAFGGNTIHAPHMPLKTNTRDTHQLVSNI